MENLHIFYIRNVLVRTDYATHRPQSRNVRVDKKKQPPYLNNVAILAEISV
jgi:hypothetical protein